MLFETPNHAELVELTGVRLLISDTIDEVIKIAYAKGCKFPSNFREKTMEEMIAPKDAASIMYQDYTSKRPMEIETYLGAPLKLAQETGVKAPRMETLYAMLHHVNVANQRRISPPVDSPTLTAPPMPRMSSAPPRGFGPNGMPNGPGRPPMNGNGPRGSRAPSMTGPPGPGMGPPPMRRGPPNGYPGPTGNGYPPRGPGQFEGNGLDEFSHVVFYDNPNDAGPDSPYGEPGMGGPNNDLVLRERELALRHKELALREREMTMRGGRGPRPGPGPARPQPDFDDDDDEEYFDPNVYRGPPVDPDSVDMMSITSRRTRKQPSMNQLRQNPEMSGGASRRSNLVNRVTGRNRGSSGMMNVPSPQENLMSNPLLSYSSDRYGGVDRSALSESRSNSLTAARLSELQQVPGAGGYPPLNRRTSQSPGNPFGPNGRNPGYPPNGRPSPPDMRQPVPRHPPGHGNAVAPYEVEQRAGVSKLYPPKTGLQVRSLTGSASASAESGESGRIDSENSAFSSQSSLGPRAPIGVR